jgi:serine/threonine protein kinase/tetratricopeptide (TPR) repeat protein
MGMPADRSQRIEDLYHAARERDPSERAAFLGQACAGDDALHREVESLLAEDAGVQSFLETPALEFVKNLSGEDSGQSMVGRQFGPYSIVSFLAKGGMGEVYRARYSRLGREVGIKVLRASFAAHSERLRRFEQEARAASALNHPNIMTVHEIGNIDGLHFMATELVVGQTLRQLITEVGMEIGEALTISIQTADALAAAHAIGIVHRDIKPENIMVRPDGYVKVLDFGLAKLTERLTPDYEPEAATTVGGETRPGVIMGTVKYMSPEQARGIKVDARTDIFSLGVVTYEMIAGCAPFAGRTMSDVLASLLRSTPAPLTNYSRQVPDELERIVAKALAKDRVERYQTISDFARDLKSLKQELEFRARLERSGHQPVSKEAGSTGAHHARHTVGRQKERAELWVGFESAAGGRGLLFGVSGEPGIGKTTLVEDFLAELNASKRLCTIARGRCSERLAGTEAYLPILEALESLLHGDASESARLMKLVAPTWYAQVAPISGVDFSAARLSADVKTTSQERMKREFSNFLQEVSRIRPCVLFLDDVHWADVSTIDLLAYLMSKFEAMRLLIVVTYRPSELSLAKHPFLAVKLDLQARSVCREIALEFLSRSDVERYLGLKYPKHCFPAELPALIHTKTEGSPLFMVDVVQYLQHRQVIAEHQGGWALAASIPAIERNMPESVRSMIQRKIDQLGEEDRWLLVGASVQGYEFDSAVIAKALEIDPADVEERLEPLCRVHAFVQFVEEKELPDGTLTLRYRFVHVLYQNAFYASLKPTRKASLSTAVANALLIHYMDQSSVVASELALLFETARDFARASEYFLLAARHAARLFAWTPASELASRGLRCLRPARDMDHRDLSRRELDLTFARLLPLASIQGYASAEVEQLTQRVVALAEEFGDISAAAAALGATWIVRIVRGECLAARDAGARLAELGRAANNDVLLMNGHMQAQIACHHLGEFQEAREHAAIVMTLANRASHVNRCISIFDPVVASLAESARNWWITGNLRRALADCEAAVALGRELRHPDSLAFAWVFHGWIHGYRGDWKTCLASSETGIAIARESGSVQTLAWNQCVHGWALAQVGDVVKGESEIAAAIEASTAIMGHVALPQFSAMIAEVLLARHDVVAADGWLKQAIEIEHSHDDRYFAAEVQRLSAICSARQGRTDHARSGFRAAIEVARSQGATTFVLIAALSLAEMNLGEGRVAVRNALADFPEPEAWPEVVAAQRLLQ